MGRKVHQKIFRIPYLGEWDSKWFAKKRYDTLLKQDVKIREFLSQRLKGAGVASINIERGPGSLKLSILTSKPGLIIGRAGADIEKLKAEIKKKFLPKSIALDIAVQEVGRPMLSGQIVAEDIVQDLEKRIPYRRTMKRAIEAVKKAGAKGVKVALAGRLGGIEIARTEKLGWGRMPLQTQRADVSFGQATAHTTYGSIGVKVWIYRGEIFGRHADSNAN